MIETIGAKNVLANEKGWLPVTEEAAIAAKPEVILTNVNYMNNHFI
jgi:iron complex transport system substrate-binding protein